MPANSIWDLDEFKPYAAQWTDRVRALQRREDYYTGKIFDQSAVSLKWLWPRLAQEMRPLYLPLARAVMIDAGLIPGGWALKQETAITSALKQINTWSKWQTRGVLYVHYGALYGTAGLKVSDVRGEKRVEVNALDPRTFMLIGGGALIVERRGENEYAEALTADRVRVFIDGEERSAYENLIGEVPVIEVHHIETGSEGEGTFDSVLRTLDEVNTMATHLATIVEKHAEPKWLIAGAEDIEDEEAEGNLWLLPQGADAKPLVAPINIAGVLAFIKEIAAEVKGGLAELAFDDLRKQSQIATATIELQLMELSIKIRRVRPNYDHGLAEAWRLAGRAAASMGLNELAVLQSAPIEIDSERPIIGLANA